MNIPLKTLLIFGLLIATREEALDDGGSGMQSSRANDSTSASITTADTIPTTMSEAPTTTAEDNTSASTTDAATTTSTQAPTTTAEDNTSASTTNDATASTQAPETGTFTTGITSKSTDDTPAITTAATTTTMSTTQGPCASSPCVGDSICEERFGPSFACICRPGLVYLETGCAQTKIFPGRLSLDREFKPEMAKRESKEFQETAEEIEKVLRNILLNENGYLNSTVLKLSQGSIIADVQNFYDLKSNATSDEVEFLIQTTIKEAINGSEFKRESLCISICDNSTTTCQEKGLGTAKCTCKEGYISSEFTSSTCLSCPNGKKAVNGECKECPFGFSGFNCSESYLLIVVVVSTVLGVLLIICIVALTVVSCRGQKDSSSDKVDFSSNYGNTELHKPAGVPRIPRANPDASWKSNNLEMTNSGSNQALVTRDRPESKALYSDYEESMSYRGQVPPAYSGHSGRGVENGVQNPYFRQDDDRMRRY